MINATCTCGVSIRLPDKAAGKRARCRKCGAVFVVGPSSIEALAAAADRAAPIPPRGDCEPVDARGYDDRTLAMALGGGMIERKNISSDVAPGRGFVREYARDVGRSFAFLADLGAIFTFAGVALALLVRHYAMRAPCFGIAISLFVTGWYYAFLLNTAAAAAGGEKQIGELNISVNVIQDTYPPLFKFLASWLIALTPLFVVAFYLGMFGAMQPTEAFVAALFAVAQFVIGLQSMPMAELLLVFYAVAMLLWPMLLLAVAVGGFADVIRIDNAAITLMRTLPASLIMLLIFLVLKLGPSTASLLITLSMIDDAAAASRPVDANSISVLQGVFVLAQAYCDVVAMRVIGLFYHHFKQRFAWEWG